MPLNLGQTPMQPGAPGRVNSFASTPPTSLGFPRIPPAQPPSGGPQMYPMGQPNGTAYRQPAPSGVMPTNPAATMPSPTPPTQQPDDPSAFAHSRDDARPVFGRGNGFNNGGFEQWMQDRLTQMAQNRPGFLDRLQSMMGQHQGIFNRLQRRDPGFDWQSFINGLGTQTPAVGAGTAPAGTPAPAPAAVAPAVAPAIFNPLGLPGIGG